MLAQFSVHGASLNSDHVYDGEDYDPDGIDEVPIHRENFEPLGVLVPQLPREPKQCDDAQGEQSHRYVKRMQTDDRVISHSEEIGTDGEALVVNQIDPLECGSVKERTSKENREEPPSRKNRRVSSS